MRVQIKRCENEGTERRLPKAEHGTSTGSAQREALCGLRCFLQARGDRQGGPLFCFARANSRRSCPCVREERACSRAGAATREEPGCRARRLAMCSYRSRRRARASFRNRRPQREDCFASRTLRQPSAWSNDACRGPGNTQGVKCLLLHPPWQAETAGARHTARAAARRKRPCYRSTESPLRVSSKCLSNKDARLALATQQFDPGTSPNSYRNLKLIRRGDPGRSPDGYRGFRFCGYGDPGRSPTCDLRVRSALLYATELPGHCP